MIAKVGEEMLTENEYQRYSRQLILPQLGVKGQKRLKESSVLLVGLGGLGATVLASLVMAGVGSIGLVDGDVVSISNLQRQVIYTERQVGTPKTVAAEDYVRDHNSNVKVQRYPEYLTVDNAERLIREYDLVINGTDNFPTRYLVNDVSVLCRKPLVDGSILRFEGQVAIFAPGSGCYRCLYPKAPAGNLVPTCADVGVLGPVASIVGALQANEAIKLLAGIEPTLRGKLILLDLLSGMIRTVTWARNRECPVCGEGPVTADIDKSYAMTCRIPTEPMELDIDLDEIKHIRPTPKVVDVRGAGEFPDAIPVRDSQRMEYEQVLISSDSWDQDAPIVFACSVGLKSGALAEILRLQGFTRVYSLRGGLAMWQSQLREGME